MAPVYLNALAGKGVHVITVNDYLARRDAEGYYWSSTQDGRYNAWVQDFEYGGSHWGGGLSISSVDQARAERIESFAIASRQLQVAVALAESLQPFEHCLRLAKAQRGQGFERVVAIGLAAPQAGQLVHAVLGVGEDLPEVPGDDGAVGVEHGEQRRPLGKAH